jgi:hypothetical protein
MNFLVDDVDQTAEILAKEGFPSLQSGKFGPSDQKGAYNYIDIQPLRAIWEPVHTGGEVGAESVIYPDTAEESPAKVKCKGINQIAIVVENLELVAEHYWNIFDLCGQFEARAWYDREPHSPGCDAIHRGGPGGLRSGSLHRRHPLSSDGPLPRVDRVCVSTTRPA